MDPVESMETPPSEDQGNIPVDAPETTPASDQTTDPAKPAETTEPQLFELPDGRKLTGEELYKEHTENLLPEFTRRSQRLSELEKAPQTTINNQPQQTPENKYADPNYVPQTYEEIIAAAEERALLRIEAREKEQIQTKQQVETQVANDIAEIKKTDPNVNVDSLFQHAVKYGFSDLKIAHKNMVEMAAAIKAAKEETAKNITKRNDPVSRTTQPSGARPNPAQYSSARDYLGAIKGST